jgi:hypothetical protein
LASELRREAAAAIIGALTSDIKMQNTSDGAATEPTGGSVRR